MSRPTEPTVARYGNWQEDKSKAPPLHGGIPDLGFREYSVQSRDDFKAPPTNAGGASYSKHKQRYGMVCAATLAEAAFAYGDGLPAGGFDTTLGGAAKEPSRDETIERFRTTAGDAAEFGVKIGRAAAIREAAELAALASTQLARPAGGKPSVVVDRGRKSVGISGEKLNLDGDARRNTIAQRSWSYGPDPGLKMVMTGRARSGAPPELDVPGMSLVLPPPGAAARAPAGALHGRHAAFAAPARSTTDVTVGFASVKRPGRHVFQDEQNAVI